MTQVTCDELPFIYNLRMTDKNFKDPSAADSIIIGAGISGVSTAYFLRQKGIEDGAPKRVTLIDRAGHPGGVIHSRAASGFLVESGPDSFSTEKNIVFDLARMLGIENEIIPVNPENSSVYLLHRGEFFPVPPQMMLFVPVHWTALRHLGFMSIAGKLRMALEFFIPPQRGMAEESLGGFIERRFGKEVREKIAQPLLGSIFGGDIRELCLLSTMPRFRQLELEYGSLIKAMAAIRAKTPKDQGQGRRKGPMMSFRLGMGQLVHSMMNAMPEVEFRGGSEAVELRLEEKGYSVRLANGEVLRAPSVCIALPARAASELVLPFAQKLAGRLLSINVKTMRVLNAGFTRSQLPKLPRGSGYFMRPEPSGVLQGCTFSSQKFARRAPDDCVQIRAFIRCDAEAHPMLDEAVLEELREHLHFTGYPLWSELKEYTGTMPHYTMGHKEKVESVEEEVSHFPGLFLTGNSYRGAGVSDCVQNAFSCADKMNDFLKRPKPDDYAFADAGDFGKFPGS